MGPYGNMVGVYGGAYAGGYGGYGTYGAYTGEDGFLTYDINAEGGLLQCHYSCSVALMLIIVAVVVNGYEALLTYCILH